MSAITLPASLRWAWAPSISVLLIAASVHAHGDGPRIDAMGARLDPPATAGTRSQIAVTLERFELPEAVHEIEGLESMLSARTGIGGTNLVGVRVHIAMPAGIRFEKLHAELADGLFLEQDRSILRRVGRFLLSVARILFFGRLIAASDALEIPGQTWALFLGSSMVPQQEAVRLRTSRTVDLEAADQRTTNHGGFVVCRLVVAANVLSELVAIRILGTELSTDSPIRYRISRMVLPREISDPLAGNDSWPSFADLLVATEPTRSTD